MIRFIVRRLLGAIPLVLGIATLIFFVLHLAPGDPLADAMGPNMTQSGLRALRELYGFDEPLLKQYLRWISNFLTGDFGISIAYGRPVRDVILELAPNTIRLAGTALAVASVLGIAIGIVQGVRQYTLTDNAISVVTLFFYSMPTFWLALMLSLVFGLYAGVNWGWPISFPTVGMESAGHDSLSFGGRFLDSLMHLFLPVLTLVLVLSAGFARYMRASMHTQMGQDYITTARAKGLSESRVILGHAVRNALLPVITAFGLSVPLLLSGAVFVETVFAWPGMGRLIVSSIGSRDIPMVMATTFIFALTVVLGNLVSDVLYALADPRIRYHEG